jgi:hypothetical protein
MYVDFLLIKSEVDKYKEDKSFQVAKAYSLKFPSCFICILSPEISNDVFLRMEAFNVGANMVTGSMREVYNVIEMIQKGGKAGKTMTGPYKCPQCAMTNLTEDALWHHFPLYHISVPNQSQLQYCTLCTRDITDLPMQVHIRNMHGPCGRGQIESEFSHSAPALYAYALVVVRRKRDGKFLLVQEFASEGYWLPGGKRSMHCVFIS